MLDVMDEISSVEITKFQRNQFSNNYDELTFEVSSPFDFSSSDDLPESFDDFDFDAFFDIGSPSEDRHVVTESDDEDNGDSDCVQCDGTVKKHRKRKRRLVLPILPKDDRRRHYVNMFTNTLNSHDVPLMQSFFRQFISKDFGLLHKICGVQLHPDLKPNDSVDIHVIGKKWAMKYWHRIMSMCPDQVVRIHDTQIITRQGSKRCEAHATFTLEFTRVFDADPPTVALHLRSQIKNRQQVNTFQPVTLYTSNENDHTTLEIDDSRIIFPIESYVMKRLKEPRQYHITGVLVLKINEHKLIDGIEMRGVPNIPVLENKLWG